MTKHKSIRIAEVGKVPCNGCTQCCHGDAVRILPHEDASQWQTAPHQYFRDVRMLEHAANGDCIYLGDIGHGRRGCTIHERRPQVCREMDCRLIYARLTFEQAKSMHVTAVWRKGYELRSVA